MAMTSLKSTKKDGAKDTLGASISSDMKEPYPYGMRLRLDEETLKKLGIKNLPNAGDELMFEAKASVISASQNDTGSGKSRSVELQITHFDLEDGEDGEEGELTRKGAGPISRVAQAMKKY